MIGDFLARSNGFGFLTPKSRHRFRSQLPLMSAANAAKAGCKPLILLSGAPEGIRTPDLGLRRTPLLTAVPENSGALNREGEEKKQKLVRLCGRLADGAMTVNVAGAWSKD